MSKHFIDKTIICIKRKIILDSSSLIMKGLEVNRSYFDRAYFVANAAANQPATYFPALNKNHTAPYPPIANDAINNAASTGLS